MSMSVKFEEYDLRDLVFSKLGPFAFSLYRMERVRFFVLWLLRRIESDMFRSGTRRRILQHYHNVYVGAYSYGSCLKPGLLHPGTIVGRYVSMGMNTKIYRKNHPQKWLSMHPFFFHPRFVDVSNRLSSSPSLVIGHDAWIGDDVTITPNCNRIGIGAVVGARSVVTKNVPDFAIVAGVPAEIRDYRFSNDLQRTILDSRWWNLPAEHFTNSINLMSSPFSEESAQALRELTYHE